MIVNTELSQNEIDEKIVECWDFICTHDTAYGKRVEETFKANQVIEGQLNYLYSVAMEYKKENIFLKLLLIGVAIALFTAGIFVK